MHEGFRAEERSLPKDLEEFARERAADKDYSGPRDYVLALIR